MDGSNTAQSYMRAYTCGGCVIMHLSCIAAAASSTWYKLGSFSASYAPKNDVFTVLWNASNNTATVGYVTRNGDFYVYAPVENQICRGTITWGIGG